MTHYDSIRLPEDIERGSGGTLRSEKLVARNIGRRQVLDLQPTPMGRWNIAYGIESLDYVRTIRNIRNFVKTVHSFRFKDWSDYQIPDSYAAGEYQNLDVGTGSAQNIQIFKRYYPIDGDTMTYIDKIMRTIVDGTLEVYDVTAMAVLVEDTDYTVDYATGIISGTFVSGNTIACQCDFDFPVTFEDDVEINMEVWSAGEVPDIIIEEIPY